MFYFLPPPLGKCTKSIMCEVPLRVHPDWQLSEWWILLIFICKGTFHTVHSLCCTFFYRHVSRHTSFCMILWVPLSIRQGNIKRKWPHSQQARAKSLVAHTSKASLTSRDQVSLDLLTFLSVMSIPWLLCFASLKCPPLTRDGWEAHSLNTLSCVPQATSSRPATNLSFGYLDKLIWIEVFQCSSLLSWFPVLHFRHPFLHF